MLMDNGNLLRVKVGAIRQTVGEFQVILGCLPAVFGLVALEDGLTGGFLCGTTFEMGGDAGGDDGGGVWGVEGTEAVVEDGGGEVAGGERGVVGELEDVDDGVDHRVLLVIVCRWWWWVVVLLG